MERDWLTRKQAAEYLQRSTATIDRWLRQGVLAKSQPIPGGTVYISFVSIEKMLEWSRQKVSQSGR